jgi:hypothetical protein
MATSNLYTPLATGHYEFRAIYSGDANYTGSESLEFTEPLDVGKAPTSVLTSVNDIELTQITLGESVYDVAYVVGGQDPLPLPTGTVNFEVSFELGPWVAFDTNVPLVPSGVPMSSMATSNLYTPLATGHYEFRAIYSGDANYTGSESLEFTEPLDVGQAPGAPPVTTLLSQTSIILGDSITDTATVTGLGDGFPMPTGTVDFQVQIGGGSWNTFDTQPLDSNGQATSEAYTPLSVDTYFFRAIYSGDANYTGSQSGDTDEPLEVNRHGSTTTTWLGASTITLGQSVTDNATVTGLGGLFPPVTGKVTFYVKVPGSGSFVPISPQNITLDGNGRALSSWYTPSMVGTYYFKAVYFGDGNYTGSASGDREEILQLVVLNPPGHTMGYWKNNIQKHLNAWPANKVKGTQMSLNELKQYLWGAVQKYHDDIDDAPQWLNKIAPVGGSPAAVNQNNLTAAYKIFLDGTKQNGGDMKLKARAQILSLLLTEQLRNAQALANGGSPTMYSDAMVVIPSNIYGGYSGTMSGAIAHILDLYNSGIAGNAQNLAAAHAMAAYINEIEWKAPWPQYWNN